MPVRPAIVAGLIPLVGPSHPVRFFGAEDEALAWLARPQLPSVLAEVATIADNARGTTPLLRSLRHRLDDALTNASRSFVAGHWPSHSRRMGASSGLMET